MITSELKTFKQAVCSWRHEVNGGVDGAKSHNRGSALYRDHRQFGVSQMKNFARHRQSCTPWSPRTSRQWLQVVQRSWLRGCRGDSRFLGACAGRTLPSHGPFSYKYVKKQIDSTLDRCRLIDVALITS